MNNLFPIEDWKHEVANDDTMLGYEFWCEHKAECVRHANKKPLTKFQSDLLRTPVPVKDTKGRWH